VVSKKAENAIKNKSRKQARARKKLEEARALGSCFVAAEVFMGNSFVRNVVKGTFLAPGVQPFDLNEQELEDLEVIEGAYKVVEPHSKPKDYEEVMDMLKRADARSLSNALRKVLEGALLA
jgi:hypothetical protein